MMESLYVVQHLNPQQSLLQGLPLEFLWLLIILSMMLIRALPIMLESTCGAFTRYKTLAKKKICVKDLNFLKSVWVATNQKAAFWKEYLWYGILLPRLFWLTVRKNCSSDREKLLKFEAEGREFAKNLRSLEQFVRTVKGQNNFW